MTRPLLAALLVLLLATLACSIQPDTGGSIVMVIVSDTPTPSPTGTALPVNTAAAINTLMTGRGVWTPYPTATEKP